MVYLFACICSFYDATLGIADPNVFLPPRANVLLPDCDLYSRVLIFMVDNAIYKNDIHHRVVKKGAELDLDCFSSEKRIFPSSKSCGKIAKMRSVSVLFLLVALTYAQEPRRCGKTKLNPS